MKGQAVYFILPPRTLLLDVAGPAEAVAMANRYQSDVRFDLRYAGPVDRIESSIGLPLNEIAPLPAAPEPDALIVVAGTTDGPEDASYQQARKAIVDWLRCIARPT